MVTIREFLPGDIEALTALMADLGYPTTADVLLKRMTRIEADPLCCTLVAEYDGKVVGMAGVREYMSYTSDAPTAQIAALVTKEEYRGLGIGGELVKQAEFWARRRGAQRVVVASGRRPERERAHRFYEYQEYQPRHFLFSKDL